MPTVEIDGVGKVELDDNFSSLPSDEQERVISRIVAQTQPAAPAPSPAQPSAPAGPTPRPSSDARSVAQKLFPNIHVTDWVRPADSALALQNPDSWHVRSKAAIDVRPLPGMTFEQYVQRYRDAGYPIIEQRDEVKNPVDYATGPHWHLVLGEKEGEEAPAGPAPVETPAATATPDAGAMPPPAPREKFDNWQSLALGAADSTTFGFADELGAGLDMVLGGPEGTETIWNSDKSLADIYRHNRDFNREALQGAQDEDPGSFLTGSLAGALIPAVRLGKTIKSVETIDKAGDFAKAVKSGATNAELARIVRASQPLSRAERFGKATLEGAGFGSLYGAGSGEGDLDAHLKNIGEYGLTGAALGGALDGTVGTAMDLIKAKPARWANREAKRNEYAAYDAEVVDDLAAATTGRAVTKSDPKGRAALTAKTINNIETGYFARFEQALNQLDIPEPQKLKLKEALTRKYAISADDINALRGTVEGDAVADAIVKVQRLRALTPELKTKAGWLSKTANVADFIPGIPGIAGRSMRAIARASGDGEAARVNAADKLIARKKAYAKLAEMVGPSGARESRDALWQKVAQLADQKDAEEAMQALTREQSSFDRSVKKPIQERAKLDASEMGPSEETLARIASAKRKVGTFSRASEKRLDNFDESLNAPAPTPKEPKITAKDRKALMRQIEDPTPDMRDVTNPVPTDRALASRVSNRNKAMQKLEAGLSDFDEQLAAPPPAPKKAPKRDAVDAMVERGIPGEFRAMQSFQDSLGISREDATRVLQAIAEEDPTLAREANRVIAGHNTSVRNMGPTLRPLMRAKMDELGIKPKSIPVDEAAQERLATSVADEAPSPTAKPTQREMELTARLDEIDPIEVTLADGSSARASEAGYNLTPEELAESKSIQEELRQLRRVDRPVQWEQGKNRYVTQATDSIHAMQQDNRISHDVFETLGNAPQQLRDNFKTTEEAEAYIADRIIPDLEAEGHTPDEIRRVRNYLMEVAQAKPYATQAQFEAGTKARPRGRPPKN